MRRHERAKLCILHNPMRSCAISFFFLFFFIMVLKSTGGDVSVYQVSGSNVSRSLPDWIARKRKRSLKNDLDYQNRIDLIQDFEFSEASNKIKVSPDGQYAMATGTYKPQIHVYDFANLSLKFDRHTDCENVDFLILSNDWSKSVHLQNDRSLEFQAKGGVHHKTRIPKFGRCLGYNPWNADLYVGASGSEVYRLNLDRGRFMQPFVLDSQSGVNDIDVAFVHGLFAAGLQDGSVEFWDPRSRDRVAKLAIGEEEVSSVAFKNDGINFAAGTSNGKTLLYDLRTAAPSIVKDQGYGYAVKKLIWLEGSEKILSSDKRIAKVWDRFTGDAFCAMEPSVDINDVEHIPNSGMFFTANEGIPMHTYYVPELGPAPRWCSFLDNVTEELEEKPSDTVYSNYKFISKEDVNKLGISHLIGSKVLRAYMHGFFIDNELYDRVKLIANLGSSRDLRDKEVRDRLEKERESRIRTSGAISHTKVSVNRDLAGRLQDKVGGDAINDDRFAEMFTNPEFQVDEQSHDFKQLNPVQKSLTAVEEEMAQSSHSDDSDSGSDSESESDSEQDRIRNEKVKMQLAKNRKKDEDLISEMKPLTTIEEDEVMDFEPESFDRQVSRINETGENERQRRNEVRLHKNAKGEAEFTFVPKKKQQPKIESKNSGRSKQRYEGRRRASKNAFRGM